MPLADTLLRLAGGQSLVAAKMDRSNHGRSKRKFRENFGLTDEQVAYRESEIRRHSSPGSVG